MHEKRTCRRWGTVSRLRITRPMLLPLSYRGTVFPFTRTNPGSVNQHHHSQTLTVDVEHSFCHRASSKSKYDAPFLPRALLLSRDPAKKVFREPRWRCAMLRLKTGTPGDTSLQTNVLSVCSVVFNFFSNLKSWRGQFAKLWHLLRAVGVCVLCHCITWHGITWHGRCIDVVKCLSKTEKWRNEKECTHQLIAVHQC